MLKMNRNGFGQTQNSNFTLNCETKTVLVCRFGRTCNHWDHITEITVISQSQLKVMQRHSSVVDTPILLYTGAHVPSSCICVCVCMWCVSARTEVKGGWSSITSIYSHTAMEVWTANSQATRYCSYYTHTPSHLFHHLTSRMEMLFVSHCKCIYDSGM